MRLSRSDIGWMVFQAWTALEIRKESDRPAGPTEAFQQENVVNFNDTVLHLLPVSEASLVQTKPGPVPENLTIHSSGKIVAMAMRHLAEVRSTVCTLQVEHDTPVPSPFAAMT